MAIAGVKPDVNESPYVQYDEDLYTTEQVREILIKFIHGLEPDDLDSIGFMYGHNLIEKAKSMEVEIVDEFMGSDGEQ